MIQLKYILVLVLILSCAGNTIVAQSTRHAERGDKFYEAFDYKKAIYFYELAHEKDPKDSHTTRRLGLSHRAIGDLPSSTEWFEKTLFLDKSQPQDMLFLAEALKSLGRYPQAIEWYKKYAEAVPGDSRAQKHLKNPEYFTILQEKNEDVRVRSLGINDEQPAFGITSFDNEYIFSTPGVQGFGVQEKSTWNDLPYLDLYVGEQGMSHELVNVRPIDGAINTRFHDGPATYDKNSQTIFVTRNNIKKGKPVRDVTGTVNLKIYEAKRVDGDWDEVRELTFNSDEFSNAHPCVSFDGKTLYFISNRPGGFGGTDLYKTEKSGEGWTAPENLGGQVNTEGNEMFPYVHPTGTLYFSSDGHAGLGGLDVFRSETTANGWTEPVNLGYPYNTRNDDFGLIFNKDGSTGYFSSNRDGGIGNDDLFWFEDNSKAIQTLTAQIKGVGQAPGQAFIKAYNPVSGAQELISLSNDGSFSFEAEAGESYEFSYRDQNGEKPWTSYKVPSEIDDSIHDLGSFVAYDVLVDENDTDSTSDQPEDKNTNVGSNETGDASSTADTVTIEKDDEGKESSGEDYTTSDMLEDLELNNVYFDYNSADIRDDAQITLEKVVGILQKNPNYRLEISAHTDSRGSGPYNEILSRKRANAAREHLVSKGISENRIVMNWYGETKQVIDCPDQENCEEYIYQMNRRAEFKIIP